MGSEVETRYDDLMVLSKIQRLNNDEKDLLHKFVCGKTALMIAIEMNIKRSKKVEEKLKGLSDYLLNKGNRKHFRARMREFGFQDIEPEGWNREAERQFEKISEEK